MLATLRWKTLLFSYHFFLQLPHVTRCRQWSTSITPIPSVLYLKFPSWMTRNFPQLPSAIWIECGAYAFYKPTVIFVCISYRNLHTSFHKRHKYMIYPAYKYPKGTRHVSQAYRLFLWKFITCVRTETNHHHPIANGPCDKYLKLWVAHAGGVFPATAG